MRRGLQEGLRAALASPWAPLALGLTGFASAVVSALADPNAAAITTAVVLVALTALVVYALHVEAAFDGPFKVLESEIIWDLTGPCGRELVVTKRQQVRFYYRTPVVTDRAWNDTASDPFSEYDAEHGEKVGSTTQHGSDYEVIVQLHHAAQRGDKRELVGYRRQRDQFPKPHDEWIELRQTQRGHLSALTVLFPEETPPHNVRLWHARDDRTVDVDLPEEQGRKIYRLRGVDIKRNDQYILKWDWQSRGRGSSGKT